MLITTTVFAATTPENTSFAYHASTLTNPNPMISPAFVEANYEILESLLRERRRQIHNEDLRTELEYFSEDYDEEREMEPRPDPHREATLTLWFRSPGVRRQQERVEGFKDAPSREGNRRGRNAEGIRSSEIKAREDSAGSVTPFVRWIEDYPLSDGLKMPSYIGSYDGKGDPDNFLHLFKEAIRMQKWPSSDRISVSKRSSQRHICQFTTSNKEKAKVLEPLSPDIQMIPYLPSIYKGLMENTYTWVEAREVATNGLKEKKEKTAGTRSEERKKEEKRPIPDKASVLMISRKNRNKKKRHVNHGEIGEITFPPLLNAGSADPIIIKAYISGRQVNRVYLDGGSSCEVIYEHFLLKLKPSIRSLRVDSNTPLVGFSGEQSWPLGEIPLEITIEEGPITVTKTLTFLIVKLDSPHNLLLGRTAMQQIGIMVSTIYGAIKFHTPKGIGTIFLEYNSQKSKEEEGGSTNKYQGNEGIILNCIDTEERVVINDKYPEQRLR
ncbi:reverse transcriptase domain-containing protein [Tanacetum coccineum]|uniref:Reverse transcriptase domain-containing protein n=1 Tax=Tanacetum coccineum TaxID=301880 RepID=A0ABQ5GT94_9ASTR